MSHSGGEKTPDPIGLPEDVDSSMDSPKLTFLGTGVLSPLSV